ncbi:MAG: hypothetical protein ABI758_06670 [Candidatus Woesebacteria bacterium]
MELLSLSEAREKAQEDIRIQLRAQNLVPLEMQASDLNDFQDIGIIDAFEVLLLLGKLTEEFFDVEGNVQYIGHIDFRHDPLIRELCKTYATEIIDFLTLELESINDIKLE